MGFILKKSLKQQTPLERLEMFQKDLEIERIVGLC